MPFNIVSCNYLIRDKFMWLNCVRSNTPLHPFSLFFLQESSFLAVVGKVGSGKVISRCNCLSLVLMCADVILQSSLLQCLLGELKALRGSVEVVGRVSYASQTPWVFSGTVRENILFGSKLDKDRYDQVVDACGLRQVSDSVQMLGP